MGAPDGSVDWIYAYDADKRILMWQNFDGVQSPNGMLVDPDEFVVEPPEDEKDDIAIIDPDQLNNGVETVPKRPRADDCRFIGWALIAQGIMLTFLQMRL